MGKILITVPVIMFLEIFVLLSSQAQEGRRHEDTLRESALKFFVDCRSCDMNYIRQEIPYVNYVRDTREAQVYLLVTSQNAGSGGIQYTFTFQGQNEFSGMNDTLVFTSSPDETWSIIREKKTNLMKMGLMRYVAHTPVYNEIEIRNNSGLASQEVVDKWNNWVFELQTRPRFSFEESYRRVELYNSINISRITQDLKFEIEIDQNFNRQRFIEEDNDTMYVRSSERIDNLIVKSIGEHWSAGIRWDLGASTWQNYKFNSEFMPTIEYNLFPYSEATHKQLRFQYSAGIQLSKYIDTTLYSKTRETLFNQRLRIAFQVQEKWGSVNISLYGSNYLDDFSKNRLGLNAYINIRIIKGLSISVNGGADYINDRLNLPKGELTEAEILLRLKQQASKYDVRGGIGLTYIFGSIYNNIVNPRFGNGRYRGGGF